MPSAIAGILSVSIGRPITYEQIPIDKVRQHNEIVARVYDFYNEAGYKVDIPALRQIHPHLLSLEAWLKKAGTAKISQLSN
ncbi:hypothetical protein LJK88_46800 [Paenibacillus sp. P26]|nr:hypothetical protein LJK88_46800 [Paenibacillus sp. P26]